MPFIDLNPASRPQPSTNPATAAASDPITTTPTPGSAPVSLPAEPEATSQPQVTDAAPSADVGLAQIASDYIDPELNASPVAAIEPTLDTASLIDSQPAPVVAPDEQVDTAAPSLDTPLSEIPTAAVEPLPAITASPAAQGVVEIKGPEFAEDAQASKLAEALSGGLEERINRASQSMPEIELSAVGSEQPVNAELPAAELPAEPTTADSAYDPASAIQLNVGAAAETAAPIIPTVAVEPTAPIVETVPEVQPVMPTAAKRWKPNLPSLDQVAAAPSAPAKELEPELPPIESLVQVEDYQTATTSNIELKPLLEAAVDKQASDLHLTVGYRPTLRIDGKLQPMDLPVVNNADVQKVTTEILDGRVGVDPANLKDLDLAYQLPGTQNRFRVNIFRQQDTLAVVFRVIPNVIRSVEELRLPPVVKNFSKFAQGLVLVTGPTGSGKSTTLAALINEINMLEPQHIVTIEDPIEYIYPKGKALIDQRTVYNDTNSWSDALRGVLRQDPNVVLVGEMRDLETISSAIRVAETGHLVFATLHTNSASQSIDRIIDVFPEEQQAQIRIQLANVLMAVVSQRLVPVTSGGRRVAAEVMLATSGVRSAIRDNKVYQIDNMIQTGAELGMMTLEKSLAAMVREGLVSVEVAQTYANRPDDLLTLLSHR